MLKYDSVTVDSGESLCITVLTAHRQIQSECVRIDDIDIARLWSAKCINSSIEWLVGSNLNGNSRVFAVNAHIIYIRKKTRRWKKMCDGNELRSTQFSLLFSKHSTCDDYSQQVPVLSQLTSVLERLLKSGSSVASKTTGNEFSVDEIAFSVGWESTHTNSGLIVILSQSLLFLLLLSQWDLRLKSLALNSRLTTYSRRSSPCRFLLARRYQSVVARCWDMLRDRLEVSGGAKLARIKEKSRITIQNWAIKKRLTVKIHLKKTTETTYFVIHVIETTVVLLTVWLAQI